MCFVCVGLFQALLSAVAANSFLATDHRKYSITSTSTQSACGASSSDRIASNTQFYVVPISETRTDSVRTSSQHVCKISDRLAFWLVCKASKKK